MNYVIIKISTDLIVNSSEVLIILSLKSNSAKDIYSNAKKAEKLINSTKGKGTKSIIVLKNDTVIASDYNADTLYNKFAVTGNDMAKE